MSNVINVCSYGTGCNKKKNVKLRRKETILLNFVPISYQMVATAPGVCNGEHPIDTGKKDIGGKKIYTLSNDQRITCDFDVEHANSKSRSRNWRATQKATLQATPQSYVQINQTNPSQKIQIDNIIQKIHAAEVKFNCDELARIASEIHAKNAQIDLEAKSEIARNAGYLSYIDDAFQDANQLQAAIQNTNQLQAAIQNTNRLHDANQNGHHLQAAIQRSSTSLMNNLTMRRHVLLRRLSQIVILHQVHIQPPVLFQTQALIQA